MKMRSELATYSSILTQFSYLHSLLNKFPVRGTPLRQRRIAFTYLVQHRFFALFYGFWAAWFQRLGAEVTIIYDDNQLDIIDAIHYRHIRSSSGQTPLLNPYRRWLMRWKSPFLKWALSRYFPAIQWRALSTVLSDAPNNALTDPEYDRFINPHVFASLVRFFEKDNLSEDTTLPVERFQKRYRQHALQIFRMGKWITSVLRPHLIISHHGFYTTWGPAYDWVADCGIARRVLKPYSYAGEQYGLITSNDDIYALTDADKQSIRSLDLTPKQIQEVEDFMNQRMKGKGIDVRHLYGHRIQNAHPTISSFAQRIRHTSPHARIIGLFPNVIWDANLQKSHRVFNGLLDWIRSTIEWADKVPHGVIIRIHPSEATVMRGTYSLADEIQKMHVDTSKVLIIPAEDPVSSYWLIQQVLDTAVVYTGFLGVEAAYLGKPTLTAAYSPYSELGVLHEPSDKMHYFTLLNQPHLDPPPDAAHNARRIIYYLIRHFRWSFPMIRATPQGGRNVDLRRVRAEHLQSDEMDRVLHRIFNIP